MSNSGLVSCTILSPNHSGARNHVIDTISIHCMAGNLSVESCGNLFLSSSRQASSNYGVGSDGRIGLYVEEKNRSWCTSSYSNDNRAVTIEVANTQNAEPYEVSEQAMKSLIKLCTDICARNGIKKLVWSTNKDDRVNHRNGCNMTVHRDYTSKSCPGTYLYNKHSYIATQVNKALGSYSPSDYTLLATSDYSGYSYIDPQSIVQTEYIHPYIATFDSSIKKIDADKLRNNDVVAAMLYAGHYYDTLHNVVSKYEPTNLSTQVSQLNDMPYALWCTCRARSTTEALKELDELYYVISKYPPKLGMWVKLETGKGILINNSILKVYNDRLVKWGLKDKCGIYATKSDMNKFTWSDFQDKYYLWMIDRVSNISEVENTLLTPEFFDYTK